MLNSTYKLQIKEMNMRTAIIVSVTPDKQLELPPDIQEKLVPGDEYLIWQTEDSITFKKVNQPVSFEQLKEKIAQLGQDETWMSEEEVCQIVKEVRKQKKEKN
jgi:hypothetical protein